MNEFPTQKTTNFMMRSLGEAFIIKEGKSRLIVSFTTKVKPKTNVKI